MTVKERIKAFCRAEGIAVSAFEESIGVSNGYVNSISKSIGIDRLNILIEKYSNINIEWVLTGRGDMYKSKGSTYISSCDNSTINPLKDTNKAPNEQVYRDNNSADIISKLVATIQEQAEEIGQLRERIAQLQREKGKNASGAQTSDIANVG